MRTLFESPSGYDFGLNNKSTVNLQIAYEDAATEKQARRLCDNLSRRLGRVCRLQCRFWRIASFNTPHIWRSSLDALNEADMIIVSAYARTPLAAKAKRWVDAWAQSKRNAPRALIGLFDNSKCGSGGPQSSLSYLRETARNGKLDYFEQIRGAPCHELDYSPASLDARSRKSSSVLDGILERAEPPPHDPESFQ